jgi:hypothetical protein
MSRLLTVRLGQPKRGRMRTRSILRNLADRMRLFGRLAGSQAPLRTRDQGVTPASRGNKQWEGRGPHPCRGSGAPGCQQPIPSQLVPWTPSLSNSKDFPAKHLLRTRNRIPCGHRDAVLKDEPVSVAARSSCDDDTSCLTPDNGRPTEPNGTFPPTRAASTASSSRSAAGARVWDQWPCSRVIPTNRVRFGDSRLAGPAEIREAGR